MDLRRFSHHTSHITHTWLEGCLSDIRRSRITVFGDFCVDAYWHLDIGEPEISIETGLPVQRVRQQRYSLGGAGNVAANLVDLRVGTVRAVGLAGNDPFGQKLRDLLRERGIEDSGILTSDQGWQTPMYVKPLMGDMEGSRIDFGAFNELDESTMDRLAAALEHSAKESDFVILNQQLPLGVSTPAMIERINDVVAHVGCRAIADARHRADLYLGVMLKLNEREAAGLCGREAHAAELATQLSRRTSPPSPGSPDPGARLPVFITRGEHGIVFADGDAVHEQPAARVTGPIDTVGAGDTVVAAIAAALAAGQPANIAAQLAMLAAGVTIQKLSTTGTATPDEIRQLAARSTKLLP